MLALLLVTVGTIGGIAFVRTSSSISFLVGQHLDAIATGTRSEVNRLLAPASQTLGELQNLARQEVLPLDDPDRLGALFVERLRGNPSLGWLGWADVATDSYLGATRSIDGTVRLNRSTPAVDGARPSEYLVDPEGHRVAVPPTSVEPYFPSQRDWFQRALGSSGLVWLEPYRFNDGAYGISAVLAVAIPSRGPKPVGVLDADFFLRDVTSFLQTMHIGERGRALIVTRSGAIVGEPDTAALPDAVRARIKANAVQAPRDSGAHEEVVTVAAGGRWRLSDRPLSAPLAAGVEEPWRQGQVILPDWRVVLVVPEAELTRIVDENARMTAVGGLVALTLAIALALALARFITEPIDAMSRELEQVREMRLVEGPPTNSWVTEVRVLGESIARMKRGLRSFAKFVPGDLVRSLIAKGEEASLGGEVRELTIQFSDLAGFTSLSERLSPQAIVRELEAYFDAMAGAIASHGGTLDKYLGDGVLSFFNAPHDLADHPAQACAAALDAQGRLDVYSAGRQAQGLGPLRVRIGISVGEVLVGNIGTMERFGYTVVGDAANLAARLEALNKHYGTGILATERVRLATRTADAEERFVWRHLDRAAVVGRSAPTELYELVAYAGRCDSTTLEAIRLYEQALLRYFDRDMEAALRGFEAAASLGWGAAAARLMAARAAEYLEVPPPDGWNGVYQHQSK
jgi:adenylate cyclase